MVILAVPVSAILKLAPKIARIVGPDCIISDVGSTKQEIVTKLDRLFPCYVGAHPMAGSEKRGIANSHQEIFKHSICILTPTAGTNKQALSKIKKLWQCLGAKVIVMSSCSHDRALSFVSHLPHIAAFSLINAVPSQCLKLASSGFKDTTRIAASDSEIWSDIFLTNRRNILAAIAAIQRNLAAIKKAIASGDSRSLNKILKTAKNKRDSL